MTSVWLQQLHPMSLPDHCDPTTPFLLKFSSVFGTCVPTPLAFVSTLLGTLSIVSWLFAQLPQIYKNYALQSTAGLSIFFLVEWCLGDSANLAGAVLTNQAGWQVTIACYYVCVDVALVSQFFWYSHYKPWQEGRYASSLLRDSEDDNDTIEGISVDEGTSVHHSAPIDRENTSDGKDAVPGSSVSKPSRLDQSSYSNEKQFSKPAYGRGPRASRSPSLGVSPHTLVLVSMLCAVLANASPIQQTQARPHTQEEGTSATAREIAGMILSWLSTVLYLGSRLPQLYKNHVRKSTAGLSPLLFIAAFCGNFFYSSSLLTNPNAWSDFDSYGGHGWAPVDGNVRQDWIARAAPFWLGAAGVLALDGAMGLQFWMYGEGNKPIVKVHVVDERGRDAWRWRRVSGWMRGWIPSASPERRASGSEEHEGEALLGASDGAESYGTA